MKKLQLAIDDLEFREALRLTHALEEYIDIIEMGSPFLMEYGMQAVREFKAAFPNKEVLADLKIMDAGKYEAEIAFRAGADYATVLGVTDTATLIGCQEAAKQYGKKIYVDMICVQDIPKRLAEIENMGIFGVSVHTGVDQQAKGITPLDDLNTMVAHRREANISVAGGIQAETAGIYLHAGADVLICGGSLCHAEQPVEEAKKIVAIIKGGKSR